MSKNVQQQLDNVIKRVSKQLAQNEFIVPQKTEQGILVGTVLIVSNGALKDLYQHNELIFEHVSLNKVAIKVATLLSLNPVRNDHRIKELIMYDTKFGSALADYQMFKERMLRARESNDQDKADIYLARLVHAKDTAEYWKNRRSN